MPTQQEFLQKLLSNIEKAQVGIYSTFHENAIVKHGYHHTETIRLAYMCVLLSILNRLLTMCQFCSSARLQQKWQTNRPWSFPGGS